MSEVKESALKEFEDVANHWEQEYIFLFERNILEAEHKLQLCEIELKHWKEMKRVFMEAKSKETKP